MSVTVWADVGGTFTDCLVSDRSGRRETKVLSSGLIRAACLRSVDATTFQLDELPSSTVDQFWVGAEVWRLQQDGSRHRLGTVQRHLGNHLSIDIPLEQTIPTHTVIELDARLEAPVLATRILLGIPLGRPLPPLEARLGTTRGTNALLTRRGAKTATLVTRGFADLLRIGEQDRPDLFALSIEKPPPLTDNVVEVSERLSASGDVVQSLNLDSLKASLVELKHQQIESLAICFLHAHVNDDHERTVERIARELGFTEVSRSSEVAPLIKLVSRAETTTLDAYLNPILAGYVARVWNQLGGEFNCRLRWMTSSGNLVAPAAFRGRDSILSGPAGGVVALGHVAERAGCDAAIGLDMGGTSTDVSRFEGRVGRRYESRVAGVRVMTPMMDIETVAAGGGSICDFTSDHRLTVGPDSAGADPGPACYGRGGPLTVTDVNLLLGRLPEGRFPFPLHRSAANQALKTIRKRIDQGDALTSDQELAEGFLDIAVTHMAEAVRTVSTAKGSDVRKMALVGFGGAAGQHLCRVANSLGMQRVLDHPEAGMLSALGMGLADLGRVVTRGVYKQFDKLRDVEIESIANELIKEADDLLQGEIAPGQSPQHQIQCDLRYSGTESSLTLPLQPTTTLPGRFHSRHRDTFGYSQPERQVELVAVRCDATVRSEITAEPFAVQSHITAESFSAKATSSPTTTTRLWHQDRWMTAQLVDRDSLAVGDVLESPALIVANHSTLVVEHGWRATVIQDGIIELRPTEAETSFRSVASNTVTHDPVLVEVVARRLQGIADAMGEVLRRTAISVNVKERRDYSCAVFRGDGSLIANAPHVPVHLGAMGHTVRRMIRQFPSMSPHDCYLSNDPFAGGSHLPDVTAVTPVFCEDSSVQRGQADFFVASRAHHAEIGGRTPGSMPPDATNLAEEGVVIRNFALVKQGESHENELRQLLSSGPYPSRCVDENLADIAAQQAAGAHGARALIELASQYSTATIDTLMSRLLEIAGDSMQRWIRTLPTQPMRFKDALDDGSPIAVRIARQNERLEISFETGPVHPHGFNATPAIVTAAVLYVLRSVSGSNLPLCDGVLRDVEIQIPRGILDPPSDIDPAKCAAVVAGNVETSQRVVDVLLGALGVAAASQGTMNNVLMGDETFGYYETIGGGSGATSSRQGADAVHTHMTNTRITDPEILESRLPVRLHRFAIRRGSGGSGIHRGGDGIIREFEFLSPLVVSWLTSRRTCSPYGGSGGEPGKPGKNTWVQAGTAVELAPNGTIHVEAGDRLIIETPGGGGWGLKPLDF